MNWLWNDYLMWTLSINFGRSPIVSHLGAGFMTYDATGHRLTSPMMRVHGVLSLYTPWYVPWCSYHVVYTSIKLYLAFSTSHNLLLLSPCLLPPPTAAVLFLFSVHFIALLDPCHLCLGTQCVCVCMWVCCACWSVYEHAYLDLVGLCVLFCTDWGCVSAGEWVFKGR